MYLFHPLHLHLKPHVDLSERERDEVREAALEWMHVNASARTVNHLLLLLDFGSELGDFLRSLAGLALQEAKLFLEVGQ